MDPALVFNGAASSVQESDRVQHTPPSSLEQRGSPKKRARFDASVLEQPQDEPMPLATTEQAAVALKDLPLPLLLLTLAQACHSSALSLHPVLSRRPSTAAGSNSHQRYAQAWLSYTRLIAAAIALLRKVVELTQGGAGGEGAAGGRMELRARLMLAEVLALCDQSARAEREKMASRGIVAAEKHPSLDPYKPYLILQQIQATLSGVPSSPSPTSASSTSTQLKFARTTLRRLLASPVYSPLSLPSPPPSASAPRPPLGAKDLPHPSWTYSFLLLSATLPATPYAEALASWREIERVATTRWDQSMSLAAEIGKARLALGEGAWEVVGASMVVLGAALGWPAEVDKSTPVDATGASKVLPSALQIQALLIAALYCSHMGQTKLAKERLKGAHKLLDAETEPGEEKRGEKEGWCLIPITPSASNSPAASSSVSPPLHSSTAVTLKLPTRTTVYQFAFLVSVAVHRDPFGSRPRSILFVNEGLKLLDGKLTGAEHPPPLTTPANIASTLLASAQLKVHLLLFSAELALMRSAWSKAESDLHLAITTARSYAPADEEASEDGGELWMRYKGRITLDMGLLAQGRGEEEMAEECFETVLMDDPTISAQVGRGGASSSKMSRRKSAGAGGEKEKEGEDVDEEKKNTLALAKVSLLILKISQGIRVRLSTSSSSGGSSSNLVDLASDTRLTALARSLADPSSSSSTVPPGTQLLSELIQALTKGEITKAKQHLSVALQLANSTSNNHAKALLLGLLGNLFVWTRNDQAQKMLLASLHIARGMGARPDARTKEQQAADKAAGVLRENEVGNARLGLWVGDKLAEGYRRDDPAKLGQQAKLNEVHRQVLQNEWRGPV